MQHPQSRKLSVFQFSLWHLFLATFVVAIFSWLVTVLEPELWLIFVLPTLPIVASSAAVLGAIYFRGRRRAFCIGFCTGLGHVVVVSFFTGIWRWGFGPREWEVVVIVPFFVLLVPGITGWIGQWFYRIANPEVNPVFQPPQSVAQQESST